MFDRDHEKYLFTSEQKSFVITGLAARGALEARTAAPAGRRRPRPAWLGWPGIAGQAAEAVAGAVQP
jgi:hypothetical protein